MTGARPLLLATALAVAAALPRAPAAAQQAQQVEREVQVPLDPERGVVEVDAGLRRELGLFPDVQGFVSARLFRTEDGAHVLEITHRDEGRLAHERRRLAPEDLDALRAEVRRLLEASGRSRVVSREGRAGLIVGETVVGLGYHGWALPVVLNIDSGRGIVATYLLTVGASFVVPWLATEDASVSVAQRDAALWGATRGIAHGVLLGDILDPDEDDPEGLSDDEPRVQLALGSLASVGASVAGYHLARRLEADPGTVALWSVAGDFGLAGAFGTSVALGLYDGETRCVDDFCQTDEFEATKAGHAVTLGLGLAALYGGTRWAAAEDYTVGDARALRSFGLLGAQALLAAAEGAWGDESKPLAAAAVLGAAAGLYAGNRRLRSTSLTGGEGLLVLAGHVAGGLGALGVAYLIVGDDADDTVYLATAAAGSAIGSLLTFRAAVGGASSGPGPEAPGAAGARASGADVTLSPGAVLAAALTSSLRARGAAGRPVPLLTIRF